MSRLTLNKTHTRFIVEGSFVLPPELRPFENSRGRRSFPVCSDFLQRLLAENEDMEIDAKTRTAISLHFLRRAPRPLDASPILDSVGDLMPHQRSGVRWLLDRKRAILADSQGTGKTVTALTAAHLAGGPVTVVCSNTKRQDWVEHVAIWTDAMPYVVESADEPISPGPGEVLVLGYEAARRHSRRLVPGTLIIDEAHNLRNRKTGQFAGLSRLSRRAKRLYLLTATPIVNGADDIWALLHLVDRERFRGYWDFAMRFMDIEHGYFGVKVGTLRADEEPAFWKIVSEYMLQRFKDETILPTLRKDVVDFELDFAHRRLYDQMLKHDEVTYEGRLVESVEAVSKVTRLRQLALDPGLIWPEYDGPSKLDVLVDLVRGHPGQIVVFTMFSTLAERAVKALRRAHVTASALHGDVPNAKRDRMLKRFGRGEFSVLVVTHGTGGEGLNLVAADWLVFLDLNWHPAGNAQARDRIYRYGQKAEHVRVTYIRSRYTIEDHVLAILQQKKPVTIEALAERLN